MTTTARFTVTLTSTSEILERSVHAGLGISKGKSLGLIQMAPEGKFLGRTLRGFWEEYDNQDDAIRGVLFPVHGEVGEMITVFEG